MESKDSTALESAQRLVSIFRSKEMAIKHCQEAIRIVTNSRTIKRYEVLIKTLNS